MKHSRTEVARWRIARQSQRRRHRWLEGQSRRYRHILSIRRRLADRHRRSMLFVTSQEWS